MYKPFKYVSKNKTIITIIQSVDQNNTDFQKIISAVQSKDEFNESIYKIKHFEIYLMLALQQQKISLDEAMTAYWYWLAKAQHTAELDEVVVFPEDVKKYKSNTHVNLISAIEGPLATKYLINTSKLYGTQFSLNDFKNFLKNQTYLNNQFIAIKLPTNWMGQLRFDLSSMGGAKRLLKLKRWLYLDGSSLIIPSMGMVRYFIEQLHPDKSFSWDIDPIFGTISQFTLKELRKRKKQPYALWSPSVIKNQIGFDGHLAGPLLTGIHDLFHLAVALELGEKNLNFIFNYVVPQFDKAKLFSLTEEMVDMDYPVGDRIQEIKIYQQILEDRDRAVLLIWLREVLFSKILQVNPTTHEKDKFSVSQSWHKNDASNIISLFTDLESIKKFGINTDRKFFMCLFLPFEVAKKYFLFNITTDWLGCTIQDIKILEEILSEKNGAPVYQQVFN